MVCRVFGRRAGAGWGGGGKTYRGHLRPVEAGAGVGRVESHGQASLGHLHRLGRAVVGAGLGHREPQGRAPVGLLWQASWSCSWGASGRVKS